MPPRKWKLRIGHIIKAIRKIQDFTKGMDFEAFKKDEKTIDAVLTNLMIIGEASQYIPQAIQLRYPEAQWTRLRDVRNFLAHVYDRVVLKTVWDTIQVDMSSLLPIMQKIMDTESE